MPPFACAATNQPTLYNNNGLPLPGAHQLLLGMLRIGQLLQRQLRLRQVRLRALQPLLPGGRPLTLLRLRALQGEQAVALEGGGGGEGEGRDGEGRGEKGREGKGREGKEKEGK